MEELQATAARPEGADRRTATGVRDCARPGPRAPLWRLHSDELNRRLIRRWIGDHSGAVLKTDLFDESITDGLLPALNRFERVCGIDVDPRIVARAAAVHPGLETVEADVRSLPFADGSFDAVVSNSTLDHFEGPESVAAALREIRRVISPAGALLVSLDNPSNPAVALRNRLPSGIARAARGGFPYPAGWTTGAAGLRRILRSAGFEVVATARICHAPRALLALLQRPVEPSSRPLALALALRMEALERLPTRALSGHFVAALARPTS